MRTVRRQPDDGRLAERREPHALGCRSVRAGTRRRSAAPRPARRQRAWMPGPATAKTTGSGEERRARAVPRHRALLLDRAHVGDADDELERSQFIAAGSMPASRSRGVRTRLRGELEPVDGDREDAARANLRSSRRARGALRQEERVAVVAARDRLVRLPVYPSRSSSSCREPRVWDPSSPAHRPTSPTLRRPPHRGVALRSATWSPIMRDRDLQQQREQSHGEHAQHLGIANSGGDTVEYVLHVLLDVKSRANGKVSPKAEIMER